ncbi:hypothetical protein B566_EDAN013455, partial [Ephemera danica]
LSTNITNGAFPDSSVKLARNYCRNPTKDPDGPWCYSAVSKEKQSCGLPFCDYKVCRHSGPGQEYQGNLSKSASSTNCLPWNNSLIPENFVQLETLYCSNPWNDMAGPSCNVLTENGEENQLCDIPICDFPVVSWKPERPPFIVAASGLTWTYFWVSWGKSSISAGQVGLESIDRVFLEIDKDNSIEYYSLSGPRAIWEMKIEEPCETHVTSSPHFSQLWPLPKSETGFTLKFMVQTYHSALLRLYHGPDPSRAVMQCIWRQVATTLNDTVATENIPPECASNAKETGYAGHQRCTKTGRPCLPWTVDAKHNNDSLYPYSSVIAASNFCRNPNYSISGTWCNVFVMAGTGNDYMGTKNVTISGRTCQNWLDIYPHISALNETRFPEQSIKEAKNYCRNPDRNLTGSWCYTTDPMVPFDMCYIRNCEKA